MFRVIWVLFERMKLGQLCLGGTVRAIYTYQAKKDIRLWQDRRLVVIPGVYPNLGPQVSVDVSVADVFGLVDQLALKNCCLHRRVNQSPLVRMIPTKEAARQSPGPSH